MKPRILNVINKSLIAGVVVSIASFFIKITPCSKEGFSLCKLPNPFQNLPESLTTQYYNISNNPATGLVLQFIIPALIFFIIFMLFRKKAAKALDMKK